MRKLSDCGAEIEYHPGELRAEVSMFVFGITKFPNQTADGRTNIDTINIDTSLSYKKSAEKSNEKWVSKC